MTALINKATLKLICDTTKVTSTYIADKIKFNSISKIDEWVNVYSASLPTFTQAKKIAKCLHVPFAGLYMNPNDIKTHKIPKFTNFRRFPIDFNCDDSSINIAITDLLSSRSFLLETKVELNEQIESFNISIDPNNDIAFFASEIRRLFDINLNAQFKLTSARQFYLYIRRHIEARGIFIHCFTDVDLEIARGIAICDEYMPMIGINSKDRPPAKTFSIIHELTHIIKNQSSLCNEMVGEFSNYNEETFCNAVAGEVLVPKEALQIKLNNLDIENSISIKEIEILASDFCVSREVIVRKLLDMNRISKISYDTYIDEFKREIEREKEDSKIARAENRNKGIPKIPWRDAIDRTSSSLCSTLYKGYGEDLFNKRDICRYLGVSQKYADKFLQEVSKWNN